MQICQDHLKVGAAVAVDIAFDNCLVVAVARLVDLHKVKFTGPVMEVLGPDKLEFVVGASRLGIDIPEVDQVKDAPGVKSLITSPLPTRTRELS